MTIAFFLVALTSLSASPIFVKWSQASIEFLGFWRLITAGLLFLVYVLFRRWREDWPPMPLQDWVWPVVSGLFFFLHLWTYVAAAKSTSVAHMVILFATNPIFTVAGAALFFGEKLKRRLVIAYPLAFIGLWLLVQEKVSYAPESQFGDTMAVLSAVLHAAYLLTSKKARRKLDNMRFSVGLYLTAGILFGVAAALRGTSLHSNEPAAWGAIAGLILFPTFLGHALMTQLVNKMDLSLLSCGKLLEPGLSTLMAYLFFQETVTETTGIAFLLTGASVLILFWPQKWRPQWAQQAEKVKSRRL